MHLWNRVNMFLDSIMFPLEWWIKWEICLRWWKTEKKPVRTNLILIRKTEMKKLLIIASPLKPQGFSGAMATE